MYDISIQEIFDILDEHIGFDDDFTVGPGDAETPFKDLGFDSLAVLELAGQLERRLETSMPGDATEQMTSAKMTQDLIHRLAPIKAG